MSQLPDNLIWFGPNANCTLELCPVEASILRYQPSVPANALFIAIFGLALVAHAVQGVWFRTWGFMASMLCGCVLEIAGYVGRLIIHDNPFDFNGFIMQIVCITIAPVFFSAAIYVLLSQVIKKVDPSISRFRPNLFYWIFIPVDIVSLVLQAAGGALSCLATTESAVQEGVNISLAGLVFQVFTLLCFSLLFVDYLLRCKRTPSAWQFVDKRMMFFLTLLSMAIFFVLLRCVYRIVELHDGYFSHWFRDEPLFIALESSVMCCAVLSLNIGHPGPVLGKKQKAIDNANKELAGASGEA
ncbi:hypothetical protein S40285_04477 [Stachybotrys chlorohalonatus IBT 40285]|uniref:Parasitic phase-specific protein PSP-1 n=1 Tax=Stachybotrys chlorohalonatus (strain IBT 40285) TaxID=1283841 RepID=A0A084QIS7_STAC4|nr:hypothetical protein S40285_04477 [Stachybotrys chlorohalonata IBT 40285]